MHQYPQLTDRRSIFRKKHTHMRVKTETGCIKENVHLHNQLPTKRPLRRHNISDFGLNYLHKNHNQPLIQTKQLAERSIFGQINLYTPKFKKHNITSSITQPKLQHHPLKQYMMNSSNKNSHRTPSRRHKTSISNVCNSEAQPPLQTAFSLIRSSYQCQVVVKNSNKQLAFLHLLIEQIYKKISKFKEVGYTDKKINEWIQNYCLQKRKYMTNLLMKASNKYKFSDTQQDYTYQKDPLKVKERLKVAKKKINGKLMPIDQYDLIEFANYIEEILIQKNRIKVHQFKNSIMEKLSECFVYNRQRNEYQFGKKLHPPDMLNFVSDMNQIQSRAGKFDFISTFNREYFNDLGQTQKDIRSKIYELMSITENKEIKLEPQQLVKRFKFDFQKNQITKQLNSGQILPLEEVAPKTVHEVQVDDLSQQFC